MENINVPDDFDPNVYLELNPDVKKVGLDAVEHFLKYGVNEGRQYKRNNVNLGIAVITCDRYEYLEKLVSSIKKYTKQPYELAVFNDSKELKSNLIQEKLEVKTFGNINSGVIRNKNRALYYFAEINPVDVLIILEDDVVITQTGWEKNWVDSAVTYGQINVAPWWFYDAHHIKFYKGGDGTTNNPALFSVITGQCTSVRVDLIKNMFGYFDSKFIGYGYGHVEWTNRFVRSNYGGRFINNEYYYLALKDSFIFETSETFKNNDDLEKNKIIFSSICNSNGFIEAPINIIEDFNGKL